MPVAGSPVADAVVQDRHLDLASVHPHPHERLRRAGVLADVGERLLRAAVERDTQLGRERLDGALDVERDPGIGQRRRELRRSRASAASSPSVLASAGRSAATEWRTSVRQSAATRRASVSWLRRRASPRSSSFSAVSSSPRESSGSGRGCRGSRAPCDCAPARRPAPPPPWRRPQLLVGLLELSQQMLGGVALVFGAVRQTEKMKANATLRRRSCRPIGRRAYAADWGHPGGQ